MHIRRWAYFFVAVLSFEFASATLFPFLIGGGYGGVHRSYINNDNEGYYGWSTGCHCSNDLASILDRKIVSIRSRIDVDFDMPDYPLEEFEFNGGKLKGINTFERYGPYRCALSDNYVRIFLRIRFPRLFVSYGVHKIKSVLSFLGGSLASLIAHFIGNVANLVLRVLIPNVYLNVVFSQEFDSDDGLRMDVFNLPPIGDIKILDNHFSQHQAKFSPYIQAILYHVLLNVCENELQNPFRSAFKRVKVERRHFSYSYKQDGSDSDDSGSSDSYGGDNRRGIDSTNNDGSENSEYRSGFGNKGDGNRGSSGSKGSDFGSDKDSDRDASGLSGYKGNSGSRGSKGDDSGSGKKSHRSGSGLSDYERNRGSKGSKSDDYGSGKKSRKGGSGVRDNEGNPGSKGSTADDSSSGKKNHGSGSDLSGYRNKGNIGSRGYQGFSSEYGMKSNRGGSDLSGKGQKRNSKSQGSNSKTDTNENGGDEGYTETNYRESEYYGTENEESDSTEYYNNDSDYGDVD